MRHDKAFVRAVAVMISWLLAQQNTGSRPPAPATPHDVTATPGSVRRFPPETSAIGVLFDRHVQYSASMGPADLTSGRVV